MPNNATYYTSGIVEEEEEEVTPAVSLQWNDAQTFS